jgi:NADH:ubiquinone oxidoreductase subunit E
MEWNLEEAILYYKKQGAPGDQGAVLSLLREIQRECGGIPRYALTRMAESYNVKEALFLALIRRIPSLRLADTHVLEICGGPNCSKRAALAAFGETLKMPGLTVKTVPCMRQCGKGPNIRFDGRLYNGADEALIRKLLQEAK